MFTPTVGEDEPILSHIFQMGWEKTTNQLLYGAYSKICDTPRNRWV